MYIMREVYLHVYNDSLKIYASKRANDDRWTTSPGHTVYLGGRACVHNLLVHAA